MFWLQKMLTSYFRRRTRSSRRRFMKSVCVCISKLINIDNKNMLICSSWSGWQYFQWNSSTTSKRSTENGQSETFSFANWCNAINHSNFAIGKYQCCYNRSTAFYNSFRSQCSGCQIFEFQVWFTHLLNVQSLEFWARTFNSFLDFVFTVRGEMQKGNGFMIVKMIKMIIPEINCNQSNRF